MSIVVPFPRARDRTFVRRHAAHIATLKPDRGERYLAKQLQIQADTLARRGVAPAIIGEHIKALESAIRAELWRVVLVPDGVA
ncbi:DUF6074 family protein [Xanthobacter sediminis]